MRFYSLYLQSPINQSVMKETKIQTLGIVVREIPIGEIDENRGQIPDVPKNPKKITTEAFKSLCDSITASPEMKEISEVKQSEQPGGCATYRNREREEAQLLALQRKWGSGIVKVDQSNKGKSSKIHRFDYNPIIKAPIKGV